LGNIKKVCMYNNPITVLFPSFLTAICSNNRNCQVQHSTCL
jgi:hypothetical protein